MESVKKDFPKAANLFRSTCDDYQFPRSCYKFASYSLIGKGCQANNEQAFTYFKKGCDYGDRDSCLYSGLMLVSSEDNKVVTIKRDYPSGMGFLKKACEVIYLSLKLNFEWFLEEYFCFRLAAGWAASI